LWHRVLNVHLEWQNSNVFPHRVHTFNEGIAFNLTQKNI
jgi:hypothetical protein